MFIDQLFGVTCVIEKTNNLSLVQFFFNEKVLALIIRSKHVGYNFKGLKNIKE